MCVCVWLSICLILVLILQHAGYKCVMSAGMFDLCYLSDKENCSIQMQSVTGNDCRYFTNVCERVCVCVAVVSHPCMFLCKCLSVCVCVRECVDRVFRDTDMQIPVK